MRVIPLHQQHRDDVDHHIKLNRTTNPSKQFSHDLREGTCLMSALSGIDLSKSSLISRRYQLTDPLTIVGYFHHLGTNPYLEKPYLTELFPKTPDGTAVD